MFSFPLGSIPVRVHFSFLLTMAFLGLNERDPARLLIWIAVAFVSVLLHELGHALMGKAFGLTPFIELGSFGGVTSWEHKNVSHWKRLLISLAGPMMGFLVYFATQAYVGWGLQRGEFSPLATVFLANVLYVNRWWSIFNLFPILPLDGGNVMLHLFAWITNGGGRKAAHVISILFAVGIGGIALLYGQMFVAIFIGLFAFQNVRALMGR